MQTLRGTLMICDGIYELGVDIDNIDQISLPDQPVPVIHNFNHEDCLGEAILSKEGNKVVATLHLNHLMHFNPSKLVPTISMKIIDDEILITQVGLTLDNPDKRIAPISKWERL